MGGEVCNDYSTWTFPYTSKYHSINEGVNKLTAKLSCDIGPFNVTKYDSVDVNGMPSERANDDPINRPPGSS